MTRLLHVDIRLEEAGQRQNPASHYHIPIPERKGPTMHVVGPPQAHLPTSYMIELLLQLDWTWI